MDSLLVAAALASALLHAAWNAAVKAAAEPTQAMTAQMVGSALVSLPLLAFTGLPGAAALPWMLAGTLFNAGTVLCMLRGYAHAGFGLVYPMARASSVLLVLPLAAAVAAEWPRPAGLAGVLLVSGAVALLALAAARRPGRAAAAGAARIGPAGLAWTLASGGFAAAYIVCDAQGVRHADTVLGYGCAQMVLNASAWSALQRRSPLPALVAQFPRTLALIAAAMVSYLLIVYAWRHAPIALSSALRDTSAIFGALIAWLVLKERPDARVGAAVALATLGAVLIRLG